MPKGSLNFGKLKTVKIRQAIDVVHKFSNDKNKEDFENFQNVRKSIDDILMSWRTHDTYEEETDFTHEYLTYRIKVNVRFYWRFLFIQIINDVDEFKSLIKFIKLLFLF